VTTELRRLGLLVELRDLLADAHSAGLRMAGLAVRDSDRRVADDLAVMLAATAAEARREAIRLGVDA
jgi:hypothetical protein